MKSPTKQPNKRKTAKTHGFNARKDSKIIAKRRKKGRKTLTK